MKESWKMRQGRGLKGPRPAQAKRRHELGGSRSYWWEPCWAWEVPETSSSQVRRPVSCFLPSVEGESQPSHTEPHVPCLPCTRFPPTLIFFTFAPYALAQRPVFSERTVLPGALHARHPLPGVPPPSCSQGTHLSGCFLWEVFLTCKVDHTPYVPAIVPRCLIAVCPPL